MRSIEAMETEIRNQTEDLEKLEFPRPQTNIDDCVITGSGDSYVASLIAMYVSGYRTLCCHPMDIVLNPAIVRNRKVYLVSVSGATKATIQAAKAANKSALKTIAITTRPQSLLAKGSDELISMQYKSTSIPTSGTIGFIASMLCCLSLVSKVRLNNVKKIYNESIALADCLTNYQIEESPAYIILGNGITFPAALYGSLKMNEVFGVHSLAYSLDEFCHSPIFSVKRNDRIIILGNNSYDSRVSKTIKKELDKMGVSTLYVDCRKQSMIETLLKSIFFLQLYAVKLAVKNLLKDCYFLRNERLLALSSKIIYDSTRRSEF
ncbi:MAG TPA: SIS domain-containing protein [Candidatus Nitrosopolaris sp.]|nr:SIS domain-containing protein [Candidatus Nitrosopolaris sp.]